MDIFRTHTILIRISKELDDTCNPDKLRHITPTKSGEKMKDSIMDLGAKMSKIFVQPLIHEIDTRAPWLHDEPNAVTSGCLSWLGGLMYIGIYHEQITYAPTRGIMALIMIYMIVDFMMDSKTPDKTALKELDQVMREFGSNNSLPNYPLASPAVNLIVEYIKDILNVNHNAKTAIMDAWYAEKDSSRQKNNTNLNEVLKITRLKGATTTMLLSSIITHNIESMYQAGEVTQLLDDLIDRKIDQDLGIETGATLMDIDEYIAMVIDILDTFPEEEQIFPWIYMSMICNIGARSKRSKDPWHDMWMRYGYPEVSLDFMQSMSEINDRE